MRLFALSRCLQDLLQSKTNPVKEAESKRKDFERYYANKRLVQDLTIREHGVIKKKWRSANVKWRDKARALRIVTHTSVSSPPRLNNPTHLGQNLFHP